MDQDDISRRACALLRRARNVTYRWIVDVSMKLDLAQGETSRTGLRHRLCMLALTCFSTFDVSSAHVSAVLSNEEDFSIAMECAVIVHDNTPLSPDDNSLHLTRMLSRHRRLLHSLEPLFGQSLLPALSPGELAHASAYDIALARLRPGCSRRNSSSWLALPGPNSRWIFCIAEGGQKIHYNLLTGELLIGGKRFGRLPQEIVEHPTYQSLFGMVSGPTNFLRPFWIFPEKFSENFRCISCRHS